MFNPQVGKIPWRRYRYPLQYSWTSLVPHMVKNSPVVRETWVQSLGWEGLLEKEMTTHSSILAWRIPWTEEPGSLQFMGHKKLDTTEQLTQHFSLSKTH